MTKRLRIDRMNGRRRVVATLIKMHRQKHGKQGFTATSLYEVGASFVKKEFPNNYHPTARISVVLTDLLEFHYVKRKGGKYYVSWTPY